MGKHSFDNFLEALAQAEADAQWARDQYGKYSSIYKKAEKLYYELRHELSTYYRGIERFGNEVPQMLHNAVDRRTPQRRRPFEVETPVEDPSISINKMDQDSGYRRLVTRGVYKSRKRFSKMKILSSELDTFDHTLGLLQNAQTVPATTDVAQTKYLVSEYNPQTAGFIAIVNESSTTNKTPVGGPAGINNGPLRMTPMQIWDLNFVSIKNDNHATYPGNPLTNRCNDANARGWFWSNSEQWNAMFDVVNTDTLVMPRYYIRDPRTNVLDALGALATDTKKKIYRNSIDIRFTAYGCKQMATEFEFTVIKITDPEMCPDYSGSTPVDIDRFRTRWKRLIRPWTINPMLKGVDQDCPPGSWFKIIAKKRVKMGEATGQIETVPTVQGRIKINLNENNNHSWNNFGTNNATGPAEYDNAYINGVTAPDYQNNDTINARPHPLARYYLLVRALSTVDVATSGQDSTLSGFAAEPITNFFQNNRPLTNFTPTYDLMINNRYTL